MNSAIYPNCKAMTWDDVEAIHKLNSKNGYGLSMTQLRRLNYEHKKARERGDVRTMERIEHRLTDINFHTECSLMAKGQYSEVTKRAKEY